MTVNSPPNALLPVVPVVGHLRDPGKDRLQLRVDQVLAEHPDAGTREKVRLAAHIIFTEFKGIPTGNQVHDLLGKGSLTTITDELRHFWRALQNKSSESLAIECIPQAVTDSFKQCVPQLWAVAMEKARSVVAASQEPASLLNPPPLSSPPLPTIAAVPTLPEQVRLVGDLCRQIRTSLAVSPNPVILLFLNEFLHLWAAAAKNQPGLALPVSVMFDLGKIQKEVASADISSGDTP